MGIKTKIVNAQVADLSSLRVEHGKRVEDFVPGGGALTPENFDAAFRACYAWCRAQIAPNKKSSYNVLLPAGAWPVSAVPLDMDGTMMIADQPPTPGIVGPGVESCALIVSDHLPSGRGLLEIGNTDFCWEMRLVGFRIFSVSTRGIGIRVRKSYRLHIKDVKVQNFGMPQDDPDSGWGLAFEGNPADHQHLLLRDVTLEGCQGGLKLHGVWQGTLSNVSLNINYWMSLSVQDCAGIVMHGGNIQGSSQTGNASSIWYGRTLTPECTTGWTYTTGLPGGTTATLSATTLVTDEDTGTAGYGVCRLTELAGISIHMAGNWIRLTKPGGANFAGSDIVSGLYQITRVISDTEVEILKGTEHSPQVGNVTWQVCGDRGGNQLEFGGFPYHEGYRRCIWYVGPSIVSSSMFKFDGIMSFNTIPLVARGADDGIGSIELKNAGPIGTIVARVNKLNRFTTDAIAKQLKLDGWTRQGTLARGYDPIGFSPRGLWDGSRSGAHRLNSFVSERSSAEFPGYSFDAARVDTHTLSGTDIQQVRSVQDPTITIGPQYAGQYASYVADDAEFGGPCWNLGGPAGATKNLIGTIPVAKLPASPYMPTLLVVARLPDTIKDPGTVRRIRIQPASGVIAHEVAFNDGAHMADGNYFVVFIDGGSGMGYCQSSPAVDTKPHAYGVRWEMRSGTGAGRDDLMAVSAGMPNVGGSQGRASWPVEDMRLQFLNDFGPGAAGLLVRWVGVLTVPLCDSELDQFLDMAGGECGVAR